jgi:hypothetical protein
MRSGMGHVNHRFLLGGQRLVVAEAGGPKRLLLTPSPIVQAYQVLLTLIAELR